MDNFLKYRNSADESHKIPKKCTCYETASIHIMTREIRTITYLTTVSPVMVRGAYSRTIFPNKPICTLCNLLMYCLGISSIDGTLYQRCDLEFIYI